MRKLLFVLVAAILAMPSQAAPKQTPTKSVDICVYGGTSAGVIAAYAVAQQGKSVLLIEPGYRLGGMSSGGLGQTDIGN